MIKRTTQRARTVALVSWMGLTACTTIPVYLPDQGPTSADVFYAHQAQPSATGDNAGREAMFSTSSQEGAQALNHATLLPYETDVSLWSRSAETELEQHFPIIPNQQLHGFVFPHLSDRGHPIPGYTTAFPLYESTHYALPGEVPPLRYRHRQP